MDARLSAIDDLPQRGKTAALVSILEELYTAPEPDLTAMLAVLDKVLAPELTQIVARQTLTEYVAKLSSFVATTEALKEWKKSAANESLNRLQGRNMSFEEQVCQLREAYADLLESDYEFTEAARVLMGIPLESINRPPEYRLSVYIRIVRLLLEEEDATAAETYFNRASLLYEPSIADLETQLQFKLCQARMFDYSRRFVEAAAKYHELSYISAALADEERRACLDAAIQCAVLAPAGPLRSRLLASLYRDQRAAASPHYGILSKMFLQHMISPAEMASFAGTLKVHQLAKIPPLRVASESENEGTGGGPGSDAMAVDEPESGGPSNLKHSPETVLDRAVVEHNLLSLSQLYSSISFNDLGRVLGLYPSSAETIARTMISQKRLPHTSIDQVNRLVFFDSLPTDLDLLVSNVAAQETEGDTPELSVHAPALRRADDNIRELLQLVDAVAARCEVYL